VSHIFILAVENARDRMKAAWEFACGFLEQGQRVRVTVEPAEEIRTLEQNSRWWPAVNDIAEQVQWPVDGKMERLDADDWHQILAAGLEKEHRVAQGISGGFVMLAKSTRKMSKKRFADLIEFTLWFGEEHGVVWTPPKNMRGNLENEKRESDNES
jgi:NinB protein